MNAVAGMQRRSLLAGILGASAAAVLPFPERLLAAASKPARRVIIDNDFGGDPDGLFMLAHFALCRSVAIPLVVGSHYRDFGAADRVPNKGQVSARKADELLRLIPHGQRPTVLGGPDQPMAAGSGDGSAASAAIIREAMRADASTPLYYAAGGSLTAVAQALQAKPEIGKRLRLVWLGGAEHPDLADAPPGPAEPEYNFSLDPVAAQSVFNESDVEIWQIPRNAFRQMLFSVSELDELGRLNRLGRYLRHEVEAAHERLSAHLPPFIFSEGETIGLGDSSLVTTIALQSAFQPDSASSHYVTRPTPRLNSDGSYSAHPAGRPMRVYTRLDVDLTWRDMLAKFRAG